MNTSQIRQDEFDQAITILLELRRQLRALAQQPEACQRVNWRGNNTGVQQ